MKDSERPIEQASVEIIFMKYALKGVENEFFFRNMQCIFHVSVISFLI